MKTKYDCSKTLDYSHELRRMCGTSTCQSPALVGGEGVCLLFDIGCDSSCITKESIKIVQEWSDSHPEMSNER